MLDSPGPIWHEDRVGHSFQHSFLFEITEDYPFQKPIVRWRTPIFHPNIMPPEEGGAVCTKLLDVWGSNCNILAFIRAVECLLVTPNPADPFHTRTCALATKHFTKIGYNPPSAMEEEAAEAP
jgi:ubiquitin-protein ligase